MIALMLSACGPADEPTQLPTVTESHPTDDAGRPVCADCHAVWLSGDGGEQ